MDSGDKYCKNYKLTNCRGSCSFLNGSIITSVRGHIREIDFPPEFNNWKISDIPQLFDVGIEERNLKVSKKFIIRIPKK
jgi:hypothetical protein